MRNLILGLSVIAIFATLSFASIATDVFDEARNRDRETVLRINGAVFFTDIADSETERREGLSRKEGLPLDHGLLFEFGTNDYHGIWMREMRFPIDVIWFDENFVVVGVKHSFKPDDFPSVAYPDAPARYVLEINAGLAREFNIEVGNQARTAVTGLF